MKNSRPEEVKDMDTFILEACVDSVESAKAAKSGRADRLELCANLVIGGTTPSLELYRRIRETMEIPIHVLIRPRFGDFLYSDEEYEIMCREIRDFVREGADAVVFGSLNADGSINEEQMKGLMDAADGKKVTLHRAFDVCRDPWEALETAKRLGIHTILTSGQEASCYDGRELLRDLQKQSEGKIEIMAGGGVCEEVIETLRQITDIRSFHMSGKETLESKMTYRNPKVNMGLPGISEFEVWRTNEDAIRRAVMALKGGKHVKKQ